MPYTPEQIEQFLDTVVEKVRIRTRFDRFDDLVGDIVSKPGRSEVVAAIYDAIGEINSYEPATGFTIEDFMGQPDTRWHRVLYLGASVNFIRTLVFDWTANGFGPQVEDLQIENKLPDYQTLLSTLEEQFKDLLEKLKTSALKLVRSSSFATTQDSRIFRQNCTQYSGTMVTRIMRSYNTGRYRP